MMLKNIFHPFAFVTFFEHTPRRYYLDREVYKNPLLNEHLRYCGNFSCEKKIYYNVKLTTMHNQRDIESYQFK